MKITKKQLKQIIKEELENTLRDKRIDEFMGLGGKSREQKFGKRQVTATLGHVARMVLKAGGFQPPGEIGSSEHLSRLLRQMLKIHQGGQIDAAGEEMNAGQYPGIEDAVAAWEDAGAAIQAGDSSQMEKLAQLEEDPRVPIFDWGSRGKFER